MHASLKPCGFLWTVALICLLGCGRQDSSLSSTAPIVGTVTYREQPLSKGKIVFINESGQAVGAEIGADGRFRLDALLGPNQISIVSLSSEASTPTRERRFFLGKSLIPEHYGDFQTSGLRMEVLPGENQKKFDLKDRRINR